MGTQILILNVLDMTANRKFDFILHIEKVIGSLDCFPDLMKSQCYSLLIIQPTENAKKRASVSMSKRCKYDITL